MKSVKNIKEGKKKIESNLPVCPHQAAKFWIRCCFSAHSQVKVFKILQQKQLLLWYTVIYLLLLEPGLEPQSLALTVISLKSCQFWQIMLWYSERWFFYYKRTVNDEHPVCNWHSVYMHFPDQVGIRDALWNVAHHNYLDTYRTHSQAFLKILLCPSDSTFCFCMNFCYILDSNIHATVHCKKLCDLYR